MSFQNVMIEIRLGNVESRLAGPIPRLALDRRLNGVLRFRGGGDSMQAKNVPLVFNPIRGAFLTGALPEVKRTLREQGCLFKIRDLRRTPRGTPLPILSKFVLRDYQKEVVAEAARRGCGLIDLGTGGGKTLLAAAIVAELGLPTLWLVTTRVLLDQTVRHMTEFFGREPGVIGNGVRRPDRITVALIQSLDPTETDLSAWKDGVLVFDEGHHAAAGTYQELIRRLSPRYQYYLSAVPFRSGSDQVILDALAGKPLTGGKYSARYLIDNGYACPVRVRIVPCRISGDMTEKPFASLYEEFIVRNAERNGLIAAVTGEELGQGRSVLVLADRIEHGEELRRQIGKGSEFASGELSGRKLRTLTESFAAGALKCLVATTGLFHEGVDISGIQALVAAGGMKSKARIIQSIGRGMRLTPGKRECLYVDFWDDDSAGILRSHSRQRLGVLKEMGFHTPPVPETGSSVRAKAISAAWSHVPGTKRFLKVDGDGNVLDRAECLSPKLVPGRFCRKCERKTICLK